MRANPSHDELMILSYQSADFQIHLPCECLGAIVQKRRRLKVTSSQDSYVKLSSPCDGMRR